MEKAKVGLYLIGAGRFKTIGEGTARDNYTVRKQKEAEWMVKEASEKFDVSFPGVIYTKEDTYKAIDQFVADKVDCVVAIYLSWTEDFSWNRFLRDMPPVPILYAHRMRDEVNLGDTHDDDEFCEYLCCGGLVGALQGSGDNKRYSRDMFETTIGTWKEVLARAEKYANAARVRTHLRKSSVGLLACYNEVMWSTYVDPYDVFMKVGPELRFMSIAELCDEIDNVTVEEAEEMLKSLSERFYVKPDVDHDKFLASVRATMAMERLAEKFGVELLVLNDVDKVLYQKVGLRPGFYPTSEGVKTVIVPEGDMGVGFASLMLKLLTGKHVNMIEPFHIDVPSDTFEGGHAGPNDYSDSRGQTQISRDVRFAKTPYKHAGAPFAWHVWPAGIKTMVHISQDGDTFKMVVTLVEALETVPHLATYCHSRFRPVGQTCKELFGKLLNIGVTQHYAIVEGDVTEEILDLGKMLGFNCHRV
ncbi:MAG: hypothetical protein E7329_06640 [Clostridiales bacterium]|nr:hypothetical protein [Clostridiales bacterium]